MALLSSDLDSLFIGELYTFNRPDSSMIMDNFTHKEINYCRTASSYFSKPVYKTRWKKIISSEYNAIRLQWIQSISVSQARGLLPHVQMMMEF